MKEYDDGSMLIQAFWKQAIESQISVLNTMANTVENLPTEMQGSCLREMCKANAAFMAFYFRSLEETGKQLLHMQSASLKGYSEALKTALSKMESADGPSKPEPKKP
jgi:TRAP-type mannitol/chloroaromatic compound transport system substrate-binding protein